MDFSTAAANLPRPLTSALFWRNKGVQSTTFERYGEELTTDEDESKKNGNFQTNSSRASRNNAGKDPSCWSSSNHQNDGCNSESKAGGSSTLTENYGPTTDPNDPPQDDDEWMARFGQIQQLAQEMTPAYVSASASTSDGDSSSSSLANGHEAPANLWTLLAQEMIEDKELKQWLMEQLQTARNGKLHPSQAKRLLDIGLQWQETDSVWNKNYQKLLGNYQILNANPSAKVEDDSPELQNWIVVQKMLSERHLLHPQRMKQLLDLARTLTAATKEPVKAAASADTRGSSRDGNISTAKAPSRRPRRSDSSQAKLPPKKRKFIPFTVPPSEEEEERPPKRSKSPNDVTQLDEFDDAVAPKTLAEPNEPTKAACFKHTAHPILCLEEDEDDDDEVMEKNNIDGEKKPPYNSSREDKEKIPLTTDVWDESIQAAHDLVDWIL